MIDASKFQTLHEWVKNERWNVRVFELSQVLSKIFLKTEIRTSEFAQQWLDALNTKMKGEYQQTRSLELRQARMYLSFPSSQELLETGINYQLI